MKIYAYMENILVKKKDLYFVDVLIYRPKKILRNTEYYRRMEYLKGYSFSHRFFSIFL